MSNASFNLPKQWHIFPMHGKTKIAGTHHGFNDALVVNEAVAKWPDIKVMRCNYGIVPGPSGLLVIDVDVKNNAKGAASLAALEAELGALPTTFKVATPSGGYHLYFSRPDIEYIGNIDIGSGIDVRCDAGYVLGPECAIDGKPYTIETNTPIANLSDIWVERIREASSRLGKAKEPHPLDHVNSPETVAKVKSALASISPDCEYPTWIKVGQACHSVGLGHLWMMWSSHSPKYKQHETIAKLNSFRKSGIGIGTLFHIAEQEGWTQSVGPVTGKMSDFANYKDIKPELIRWLWPSYLAIGKVTLIAGDPGVGKGQLVCHVASVLTRGQKWPDGSRCNSGNVLLIGAEDDPADTVAPRLLAAGADLSKVTQLTMLTTTLDDGEEVKSFPDLSQDLPRIEEWLVAYPDCKMIVIDPIGAYLGDADSYKDAEVRRVLTPLAELAARYGICMIWIAHTKKGANNAIDAALGSKAFVGIARLSFLIAKDPDNPNIRVVASMKSNIGPDAGQSLAYHIESVAEVNGVRLDTGKLVWRDGGSQHSASSLLAARNKRDTPAVDAAEELLTDMLEGGSKPSSEIFGRAKAEGISASSLRAAKKRLDIEAKKDGLGKWFWHMPDYLIPDGYSTDDIFK